MLEHLRLGGLTGRLRLIVALIALGLGLSLVVVVDQLQEVHQRAGKADSVHTRQLAAIASVELNITRISLQVRHAMLARDPAQRQAAFDDIAAKRALIEQALTEYGGRLDTDEGRRRFAAVPGLTEAFWRIGGQNLELVREDRLDEAFAFLVERTIPARNALLKVLDETVVYQRAALQQDIVRIGSLVRATLLVLGSLIVATVLCLGAFAWWLGRRIHARVGDTMRIAERVRDGDRSAHAHEAGRDEFTPLLRALDDMRVALSSIVQGVRDGARGVEQVVAGMSEDNDDLARRTVAQGSELERTTRNMTELGRTVEVNADQSTEATHLAGEATRVAQRGGELMTSVVDSMSTISDTSRRIGDIIGTIDAIAFQTNLLALNAAVEAARAGEQGRGFAVVAGEVRQLARRSSDAAREIKQLIQGSMQAVDDRARLVGDAGRTMNATVQAIRRVQDLITGINEASQQQRQGIDDVGASVRSLDAVTGQNTALVQQAAISSQRVLAQARELVAHVSAFRLSADEPLAAGSVGDPPQGGAKAPRPRGALPAARPAVARAIRLSAP